MHAAALLAALLAWPATIVAWRECEAAGLGMCRLGHVRMFSGDIVNSENPEPHTPTPPTCDLPHADAQQAVSAGAMEGAAQAPGGEGQGHRSPWC